MKDNELVSIRKEAVMTDMALANGSYPEADESSTNGLFASRLPAKMLHAFFIFYIS
jgi:hypothetical protein